MSATPGSDPLQREPSERASAPPGGRTGPADARPAGAFARLWRSERPAVAVPRDVLLVVVVLAVTVGSMWLYSGQAFPSQPPLVVVESGSMMHPDPAYGRVGTIDAGDLIIVKAVDVPAGIATAYDPDERSAYGGHGDVIVYLPLGDPGRVPIIHRALTWVEVHEVPGEDTLLYSYRDQVGVLVERAPSVDLPEIGMHEMRPPASGYVTKGDNPMTNVNADQVTHMPGRLVEPEWVVGAARGEIPWLGLVKLALSGNSAPPDPTGHCLVLRGWGPCDAWLMLGTSFFLVIAVPLGLEALYKRSTTLQRWTA